MLTLSTYGDPVSTDDLSIPKETLLAKNIARTRDDILYWNVTGFLTIGRRLHVILPRVYNHRFTSNSFASIRLLFRVLRRYASDIRRQRAVDQRKDDLYVSHSSESQHVLGQLEAAFDLLEDFQSNGLFQIATRKHDRARGRINWKRTIRHSTSTAQSDNEIFLNLHYTHCTRDPTHPLTALHQTTVSQAKDLLGLSTTSTSPRSTTANINSTTKALETIQRLSRTVFSDRGKYLLKALDRFHSSSHSLSTGRNFKQLMFFTTSFHSVWERMLQLCLAPLVKNSLARGAYYDFESLAPVGAGLDLRPDLCLEDGDFLFILDAKDYQRGSFPSTADICKQLLYRLIQCQEFNRECSFNKHSSRNAFLMPSVNVPAPGFIVRNVHRLENGLDWGIIYQIDVDYKRVATAYVHHRPDSLLRQALLDTLRHLHH